MPVFISHRTADDALAQRAHQRLTSHGIKAYIDDLDPLPPVDVGIKIRTVIDLCTHLLVVATTQTAGSWWVPYEIGYADKGQKRLATWSQEAAVLPEYLKEHPIMTREDQLDQYARLYFADQSVRVSPGGIHPGRAMPTTQIRTVAEFRTAMSRVTGQTLRANR